MAESARHSVLVVESHQQSRRGMEALLRDYDYVFASDPRDALLRVQSQPCDAYVLDYWMPDWSGPLLCRQIRKGDPHCAVIICGCVKSAASENRGISAGASACLDALEEHALAPTLSALVAVTDVDSLRAERAAGRMLTGALTRQRNSSDATRTVGEVDRLERTLRPRILRAYIDGGGTRACFERWWPGHFRQSAAGWAM